MLGRRGTRYGAGAAVMILLALGVVVFANALSIAAQRPVGLHGEPAQHAVAADRPGAADASRRPSRRSPSSAPTRRASAPRRTCSTSTPRTRAGKFTWRLEDTDKAPGLAREYGVESYGTVVLKGGRARRAEDREDARRRGGEAHQRPRQGDALGEADRVRAQGTRRARDRRTPSGPGSARPRTRWRRPTTRSRSCSSPASRRCPTTPRW